jgi:hypothetical protein
LHCSSRWHSTALEAVDVGADDVAEMMDVDSVVRVVGVGRRQLSPFWRGKRAALAPTSQSQATSTVYVAS